MEHKFRNKTVRKPSSTKKITISTLTTDESKKKGIEIEEKKSIDPGIFSFLNAESISALKKPWLRLERGTRMQKFRQFADDYEYSNQSTIDSTSEHSDEHSSKKLTSAEKDNLIKVLVTANDEKQLNSKQNVIYDIDSGKIVSIKGLKMVKNDEGVSSFKIELSKPTKRAKHVESKIELDM